MIRSEKSRILILDSEAKHLWKRLVENLYYENSSMLMGKEGNYVRKPV